jgi:DNA polymerase-3 subunit beta
MKVSFNRAALAEALGLVGSVVPARTPKPILRCVRLCTAEKSATVSATNLEVGLTCSISAVEVHRQGEVIVEADHLAAIVSQSPDEALVLELVENNCSVTGADSRFTLYCQDPAHYPKVPGFDGEEPELEVPLDSLQAGISQCLFATAKESSRYAINGVLWEFKGKKLLLVATDGRRLARTRVELRAAPSGQLAQQKMIVPARTMGLLERVVSHDKETVAVKLVDNQVLMRCSNVVIGSTLVEGNFPKYEDIIPSDYDKKLTLPTEQVLSAVRRASLLTSEESKGIKLSISKDALVFSGSAPEAGNAEINMMITYKGEPIDIGFNPQFLIDALRAIRTPEFELELGQADRPGVLKSGADFLYVLMPINLG